MNKIIYFNNCWFTNVGEAFIDIGANIMIKKIFPGDTSIVTATDMSTWYINDNKHWKSLLPRIEKKILPNRFKERYLAQACNNFELYSADYFVLAGMFASDVFLNSQASKEIIELKKRGIKIIFLGLGGELYSESEIRHFKDYLEKIKPSLIVTRDTSTYNNYRSLAPCVNGIDCAFWIVDIFNPIGFAKQKYDLVTFNRSSEPIELRRKKNIKVIRPNHFQYKFNLKKVQHNMMISDSPYDYLSLYANAHRVYTDLVHATIPCLQYNIPVKFYPVDGRAQLFDNLNGLKKDTDGFYMLDNQKLEKQKEEIINQIKKIMR